MKRQSVLAYVLIALAAACYGLCLGLPALVFEPHRDEPDFVPVTSARAIALMREGKPCRDRFDTVSLSDAGRIVRFAAPGRTGNSVDPASLRCRIVAPAVRVRRDSGLTVLATGWLGVFALNIAWYANLVLLAAFPLALMGNTPGVAASVSGGGFVVGLDAFLFDRKPLDIGSGVDLAYLGSGFYVWEGVFLLLVLSQVIALRRPAPPPRS